MGYSFGKNDDSSKIPRTAINVPARPGSIDPKVQQVDIFPLDAFLFDDPNKTANPRVMLKEPWVWEVQAEIDALDAGVVKLGVQVQLSALSASRTRAGLVEPSNLTATAVTADGAAYTGRYKIFLRYNGSETIVAYTSSVDELSKVYLIPATVEVSTVVYDVEGVIVRVYTAGGTAELLDEKECLVTLKIGSASVYWGSLETPPTLGFLEGDVYWDNRDPVTSGPAEGGVLRIYSSGAWIEFISSANGYSDAAAKAITDMMIWARAKGVTTLAAANAVFGSIAATEAFITVLEAQTLSVNGTVKTGAGATDNARIAIIDETGTSGLAFSGTGVNDMAIVDDGAVDGGFTVKITKQADLLSTPALESIGPGGGKIFYVDPAGRFALECAPSDLTGIAWSNITNAVAGASYGTIGDGVLNSVAIVSQSGHVSSPAKLCLDYEYGGKSDWYAPNRNEYLQMLALLAFPVEKRVINNFVFSFCWTSDEASATNAWLTNTTYPPPGLNYNVAKTNLGNVRPIRRIDLIEKYQWREDSHAWSPDIEIVAGAQTTLTGYDIKIAFGSQIGHVLNDQWTFKQGSMIGLSIRDVAGVEYVHAEDGQLGIAAPQTVTATGNTTLSLLTNSVLVTTADAVTLTIPNGCAVGHEIRIIRTVTSTNAITVARSGTETIEGAATFITHGSWVASTLNLSEVVLKKVSATEWRFVGGEISGSGAMGKYTRFASGRQICSYVPVGASAGVDGWTVWSAEGTWFSSTKIWTFPIPFVPGSQPAVSGSGDVFTGLGEIVRYYSATYQNCTMVVQTSASAGSAAFGISFTAEGRWRT